jgi:hypothetical protein
MLPIDAVAGVTTLPVPGWFHIAHGRRLTLNRQAVPRRTPARAETAAGHGITGGA